MFAMRKKILNGLDDNKNFIAYFNFYVNIPFLF